MKKLIISTINNTVTIIITVVNGWAVPRIC